MLIFRKFLLPLLPLPPHPPNAIICPMISLETAINGLLGVFRFRAHRFRSRRRLVPFFFRSRLADGSFARHTFRNTLRNNFYDPRKPRVGSSRNVLRAKISTRRYTSRPCYGLSTLCRTFTLAFAVIKLSAN